MEKEIKKLKEDLIFLHNNSALRKPIVIEFCGSPKSGKSTCIEAVKNVLRECNFNVYVIHEKAKICPLSNKIDPMFNLWTVTNSINELAEVYDRNYLYDLKEKIDNILIDRGIFDSLIWFEWLNTNSAILDNDLTNIVNYLTWSEIRKKLDKVFVFKSDKECSLEREPGSSLIDHKSIIMNPEVLIGFNSSMERVVEKYGKKFNFEIRKVDKDWDTQIINVAHKALSYVITQFDEQICYIDKKELFLHKHSFTGDFDSVIPSSANFYFKNRTEVEEDSSLMQIIPIAVIIKDNSVLCVHKTKSSLNDTSKTLSAPEKNKDLFYVGGHVRKEDSVDATNNLCILRNALHREIKEEINLTLNIPNVPPHIIFSNAMEKSRRHLACCWVIEIGPQKSCVRTNGTELVKSRKTNVSGSFVPFSEINEKVKFEEWSKLILTDILKDRFTEDELLRISSGGEQYSLFD